MGVNRRLMSSDKIHKLKSLSRAPFTFLTPPLSPFFLVVFSYALSLTLQCAYRTIDMAMVRGVIVIICVWECSVEQR
jgi:hypothetical protein